MKRFLKWILNKLKTYWAVIVTTVIYIILLIWYRGTGVSNPVGKVTHYIVLLWGNIGIFLASAYLSLIILVPTISFETIEIKKEFINEHIGPTIVFTWWCLMVSAIASLLNPITCELAGKNDCNEGVWMFVGSLLLASLIIVFAYFLHIISKVCYLYKKDTDKQLEVESE